MANDNKKTTFSGFAKYLFDNKLLNEDDIISSLAVKSSSFIDVIYHIGIVDNGFCSGIEI